MTYQTISLHAACTTIETVLDEKCTIATVPFFSWSVNCLRVLTQIAKRPCSHAELRQRLEMHRTTLRRKLNQLEDHRWIEERPAENLYQLSPAGQFVIKGVAGLLQSLQTASRLSTFQEKFSDEIPIEMNVIDSCEITLRRQHDPYAPTTEFLDVVNDTAVFRAMLPSINPYNIDVFIEKDTDDTVFEIISTTDSFELLRNKFPEKSDILNNSEKVDLFIYDELPPFGICLYDDGIMGIEYDSHMSIEAVLTAPDSCQKITGWAEHRYEFCKQEANVYSYGSDHAHRLH